MRQVLWRRLSVFPATFDLELAESVCAFDGLDPDAVLDSIERLVAQSILSAWRGVSAGAARQAARRATDCFPGPVLRSLVHHRPVWHPGAQLAGMMCGKGRSRWTALSAS